MKTLRKSVFRVGLVSFLMFAVSLGVSVRGWAQEKKPDAEVLARMEKTLDDTDRQARNLTGQARTRLVQNQAKLKNMVERLRAGGTVDPKEIDEVLKQYSR